RRDPVGQQGQQADGGQQGRERDHTHRLTSEDRLIGKVYFRVTPLTAPPTSAWLPPSPND
ncbi:MAG: hypothetical protein K2Y02_10120, partial [Burkholderiaceae bacterium]|nr:hypothetical protein [Burkholderiaceae bacterium]